MTGVVIIGGTSGLGRALASEFLREGCRIVLTGRDPAAAAAVARSLGRRATGLACDVTDVASVQMVWDRAVAELGVIDHWVQNAGIGTISAPIADLQPAEMANCIAVNLVGALTGAHVAARGMANGGGGWIWLTEGLGSTGPVVKGSAPYAASKAGATRAFAVLALECRDTPVKVGFLRPTLMPTALVEQPSDPREAQTLARMMRLFGETPYKAAAWFAPRMLAAQATGTRLTRVSPHRLIARIAGNLLKQAASILHLRFTSSHDERSGE